MKTQYNEVSHCVNRGKGIGVISHIKRNPILVTVVIFYKNSKQTKMSDTTLDGRTDFDQLVTTNTAVRQGENVTGKRLMAHDDMTYF